MIVLILWTLWIVPKFSFIKRALFKDRGPFWLHLSEPPWCSRWLAMSGENRCVLWDHDISLVFWKRTTSLCFQGVGLGVLDAWCPSQVEWKVPLTVPLALGLPRGPGSHSLLIPLVFADTVLLLLQVMTPWCDSVGWRDHLWRQRRVSFEAFCLYVNFPIYVP